MSVTGFNRRRRELAITEVLNKEALDEVKEESIESISQKEVGNETEEEDKIDYSKLKVDELKNLLDEKEIEYDSKAKKEDLIKLLEGAE